MVFIRLLLSLYGARAKYTIPEHFTFVNHFVNTSKMSRSSAYYGGSAGGLRRGAGHAGHLKRSVRRADMYDSASMESKKMIVSCLIRRVEVYRDYRLHIDFNIDFEQFSAGLDISAIAA